MAKLSNSGTPQTVTVNNSKVTTPTIINQTLTNPDTEYIITLPSNVSEFKIKARGTSKLKLAYVSGESGSNYITLYPGDERYQTEINRTTLNLYVQASKAGEIIEVECWV